MASLPSAIPGRYFVADEQETAGAALTFPRGRVLFAGNAPAMRTASSTGWPLEHRLAAGA